MKICYPIRDTTGKNFTTVDEVMELVNSEYSGTWLLGTNGLWHGGIHFSDQSAPHSVLNENNIKNNQTVPLQCVADGKIVAYRLNSEYISAAEYCGKKIRYSSSFVLVRSICQPNKDDEETWLTFYTLYLHLAPLSDYPKVPCYKVKAGKTLAKRKYTKGNHGIPDGTPNDESKAQYTAPDKEARNIKKTKEGKKYNDGCVTDGDRLLISLTGNFYLPNESVPHTFGLARKMVLGKPTSEQFWISLSPDYVEPDGEIRDLMPEWVSNTAECGRCDSIVLVSENELLEIKAGSPIGYIGCMESPTNRVNLVDTEYYVHIELISTDTSMPKFLSNPKAVTEGKKYIKVLKGKQLFIQSCSIEIKFISIIEVRLNTDYIIPREKTTPVKDSAGATWFNITGTGWVKESDVEEVSQYDLEKLGFIALEENTARDVMGVDNEAWITEAFTQIAETVSQTPSMDYAKVSMAYRNLVVALDSNRDGLISEDEVRQALTIRDPLVQQVVNRLVVKHHSEWFKRPEMWKTFFEEVNAQEKLYCKKWLQEMEWMSQVPPFDKGDAVWHFHPVVFLDAIADNNIITYHIYWNSKDDGRIEKHIPSVIDEEFINKYKYIYHDKSGCMHDLGVFIYETINNQYGEKYGGEKIDLIDIRQLKNYSNGNVKFSMTLNTSRYWINDKTLASLLGALLECGYDDFVFNGFSHKDGSSNPSVSHKNGFNGDLRYLRKDRNGGRTNLFSSDKSIGWAGVDIDRQNKFNDALFKFGWKSMLSQTFNVNKIFNHCKNDQANHHNDHLHVQSYLPNYEEISK
ncbi:MAG: chitinase [Enterobacteriaceae bacterium]|jgi:hypothetical protein|nr:chitinase [Enterobacteriaceae bacterium]